jgi:hypothetical protein
VGSFVPVQGSLGLSIIVLSVIGGVVGLLLAFGGGDGNGGSTTDSCDQRYGTLAMLLPGTLVASTAPTAFAVPTALIALEFLGYTQVALRDQDSPRSGIHLVDK